jgi:hypothetical protein
MLTKSKAQQGANNLAQNKLQIHVYEIAREIGATK